MRRLLHTDPQPQPSPRLASDLPEFILQNFIGVQHDLGCVEIALPRIGGPEGQLAPVKEGYSGLLLHLVEHLAEGGLGDV